MKSASAIYLLSKTLASPLEVLFTFLIFIVTKHLGATPFQLTVMASLKPISSIFSFYLGALLRNRPYLIKRYLILNTIAGSLPCFFFPFMTNVWFYILSFGLFMVTLRALTPAWVEFLKRWMDIPKMGQIVSRGSSLTFGITIFLPTLIAYWLDLNPSVWKWLYTAVATINFMSIPLICSMKIPVHPSEQEAPEHNFYDLVIDPIAKGWHLLRRKPLFTHYLLLFFAGGIGLVGTQSILPVFFKQNLQLSYTELALAFSFCKGIAFIATAPFWAKYLSKKSLYLLNCYVNVFTCLFFCLLLVSNFGIFWLYPAYLSYGTMRAGCELSMNLSGAIFSEKEESSFYSSMNLALIGIRGVICPFLGYLLFSATNANITFVAAFSITFAGILYGLWIERYSQKMPASLPATG